VTLSKKEQAQLAEIAKRGGLWAVDRMPTFLARVLNERSDWGAHYAVDMGDLLAGYAAVRAALEACVESLAIGEPPSPNYDGGAWLASRDAALEQARAALRGEA
jgi:hypothetical protein